MKKRLQTLLLAGLLLLSGCAQTTDPAADGQTPTEDVPQQEEAASPEAQTFTDDLGREVSLETPKRVAAMIGSFADIWCIAGGKDTLIAAAHDSWTSFDLGLGDDVTDIGAVKDPSLETLLAAEPDLILASCNTSANVEMLETIEQAGLRAAYFDVENFDDYLRMLEICTRLTGCPENYAAYGEAVKEQVDAAVARQDGSAPTVLYIRASGSSCKVKGSSGNVLGEMLSALGCVNIADSDQTLLENLSLEAIIADDPDYIFAVLQGVGKTAEEAQALLEETLLTNPAWEGLRAVQEGRFYTLDHALYNLKPNARWGEAYEALADILYPQ
ncbi:MAG: ABC transporter substrate-binding protein [Oscillibacter sp.]|nr:ABC transporter substrate-binding protein [Oscillibacter sp.]